jgi:uridine kinase
VIIPPAVVLILGKRGSGKSALAYRLLELFRYQVASYVVGASDHARKRLPDWIGIVPLRFLTT